MSAPRISVVMPTFGRADVLPRTLRAYVDQLRPGVDELLVVDDGSTDATPQILAEAAAAHPELIKTWRQNNAGPATARNRALAAATGDLVLFAGDDVIPTPGFVNAHATAQQRFPNAAIVGLTRWHAEMPQTPLFRWLEQDGTQFAFRGRVDGERLPPTMFYSSNLSVPRHLLPSGPVFDETFPAACWEDIDLGMRLAREGLEIRFVPAALAHHWHPMDMPGLRRRAERVGYYGAQLRRKHGLPDPAMPEWKRLVKATAAPLLRRLPHEGLRGLGYRWTLAGPEWRGIARFQAEQGASRPDAPR